MTQVTIIIHEGHGGPRGRGRHQRPFGRQSNHEEGHQMAHGPRHGRHGGRAGGCEGHHEGHGGRAFGRRHYARGEGEGAPGRRPWGDRPPLSEAERRAARQVRHEVRRIMRAAEEAGLSPERVARLVRRQTRPNFD